MNRFVSNHVSCCPPKAQSEPENSTKYTYVTENTKNSYGEKQDLLENNMIKNTRLNGSNGQNSRGITAALGCDSFGLLELNC